MVSTGIETDKLDDPIWESQVRGYQFAALNVPNAYAMPAKLRPDRAREFPANNQGVIVCETVPPHLLVSGQCGRHQQETEYDLEVLSRHQFKRSLVGEPRIPFRSGMGKEPGEIIGNKEQSRRHS